MGKDTHVVDHIHAPGEVPASRGVRPTPASLALACLLWASGAAQAQDADERVDRLQRQVDAQALRIDALERAMAERDDQLAQLQQALDRSDLESLRARGAAGQSPARQAPAPAAPASAGLAASGQEPGQAPVGQAPPLEEHPPEVARIFDQPSVLTPAGELVLEPSLQFGYSANERVALVGYTVVPALLIGLIDVRQVKTTTATAALTARYGLTDRLEVELRVPWSYIGTETVSREIFTGSAQDRVFEADGKGLGDVELGVRYQLNRGNIEKPFYVGWLRYKSRTGTDPFEVVTDCVQRCVGNATGTGLPLELPTGSGFQALQAGVTWLYASDPSVFFGSFSYLHNFTRHDVSRQVLGGQREFLGEVDAGDIVGFNLGMGLALNEKASISLGYEQSFVGRTQQNGEDLPGSARIVLGTLLIGASYRFSERNTTNFSLGIGVTRDTPDVVMTVRTPFSF